MPKRYGLQFLRNLRKTEQTGKENKMRITFVNTYFVRPRWGFVEIGTDEGFTGWGEAVLEGHAAAVLASVQ